MEFPRRRFLQLAAGAAVLPRVALAEAEKMEKRVEWEKVEK